MYLRIHLLFVHVAGLDIGFGDGDGAVAVEVGVCAGAGVVIASVEEPVSC